MRRGRAQAACRARTRRTRRSAHGAAVAESESRLRPYNARRYCRRQILAAGGWHACTSFVGSPSVCPASPMAASVSWPSVTRPMTTCEPAHATSRWPAACVRVRAGGCTCAGVCVCVCAARAGPLVSGVGTVEVRRGIERNRKAEVRLPTRHLTRGHCHDGPPIGGEYCWHPLGAPVGCPEVVLTAGSTRPCMPACRRRSCLPCHICAGTGLAPATSAPGLRVLQRWARSHCRCGCIELRRRCVAGASSPATGQIWQRCIRSKTEDAAGVSPIPVHMWLA